MRGAVRGSLGKESLESQFGSGVIFRMQGDEARESNDCLAAWRTAIHFNKRVCDSVVAPR